MIIGAWFEKYDSISYTGINKLTDFYGDWGRIFRKHCLNFVEDFRVRIDNFISIWQSWTR